MPVLRQTPPGDQVVDLLVLIRRAQALRVGQEVFQLLDLAASTCFQLRQFRQELVGYLLLKCRHARNLHPKDHGGSVSRRAKP